MSRQAILRAHMDFTIPRELQDRTDDNLGVRRNPQHLDTLSV